MPDIVICEFMDAAPVERLKQNHTVHWDDTLADNRSALLELVGDAAAIIVRNRTQVDVELLGRAPNLKVVGRLGVGLDNIDMMACKQRNVTVCPATGANAPSVAEYVMGAAFSLVRGAFGASMQIAEGQWPRAALSNGGELAGRTMGLVGFGGIGQLVAQKAQALGMKTVAYDPLLPDESAVWQETRHMTLEEVLAKSDVISLHVPLTDETRGMISSDALATMKLNAVLINTARGGIVDEQALADALRDNRLGGAALDVFETEPPEQTRARNFAGLSNVILTPHIAGLTQEANSRVSELTVDNVLNVLEGRS